MCCNIYRQIMQPDCKPMPPKSLQNDAAIPQNPPKMIAESFKIIPKWSKTMPGTTPGETPEGCWQEVSWPKGSLTHLWRHPGDFGRLLANPLASLLPLLQISVRFWLSFWTHFPYILATFSITCPNPIFAQILDGFVTVFETAARVKKRF